jgi:adenosyl cobinamide kinase/adenosyl cobinamide phosphate guanylyltransferase
MELRIAAHRRERPDAWELVEEPYALEEALAAVPPARAVLVDCLSLWTANALERGDAVGEVLAAAERTAAAAAARPGLAVAVTNEVGLGVVPATPLGRSYRDVLGSVNRCWAAAAASAALVVAGRVLELEGAHAWLASLGFEGSRR